MTGLLRLSVPSGSAPALWVKRPDAEAVITRADHDPETSLTGVTVELDTHPLLRYTLLFDAELAALRAEVDAYNDDPEAGWERLLADLAGRRTSADAGGVYEKSEVALFAAQHLPSESPFTLLSVDNYESVELITRYGAAISQAEIRNYPGRLVVEAPTDLGADVVLAHVRGDADIETLKTEVTRFNQDPQESFRALLLHALQAEYRVRAAQIRDLAELQRRTAADLATVLGSGT